MNKIDVELYFSLNGRWEIGQIVLQWVQKVKAFRKWRTKSKMILDQQAMAAVLALCCAMSFANK